MKKQDKLSYILEKALKISTILILFISLEILFISIFRFIYPLSKRTDIVQVVEGISGDGLAGLLGSIMGCSFSIVAVMITVYFEKKNREEDNRKHEEERSKSLAIEYRPILDIENFRIIAEEETDNKLYDCQFEINGNSVNDETIGCRLNFNIVNIGRGEVVDMNISASCTSTNNIYSKVNINEEERFINLLAKEAKLDCLLNIVNLFDANYKPDKIKATINIEYTNLNRTIRYSYVVLFEIEIKTENLENLIVNDYRYQVIENNKELLV